MRRYRLERNANGMITQCDNADGGNIYAQREEINKRAMENLERSTPGKLGGLSNVQIFNFEINDIATGTDSRIFKTYNSTNSFPANATQTIMFGVDGLNNKALYFNIISVNARYFYSGGELPAVEQPAFVSFYLLQNIEGSTTSLGTKIPQPAPLYGNGGGAVTYTTSGDIYGHQSLSVDLVNDTPNYAQNNNLVGYRASGLALKNISIAFDRSIATADIAVEVDVTVDTTSVSSTF